MFLTLCMHYHNLVCLKVLENILFCKHGRDCWASDLCNFHTADYMKIGSACCSACWLLPLVPLREDHTQRRQINSACLACSYGNCFFFCTFVPQRNGIGQTFISKVGTAKYLDPGVAGKLKAEAEGIILSASFLPEQFFIRLRTCFFVTGTVIF